MSPSKDNLVPLPLSERIAQVQSDHSVFAADFTSGSLFLTPLSFLDQAMESSKDPFVQEFVQIKRTIERYFETCLANPELIDRHERFRDDFQKEMSLAFELFCETEAGSRERAKAQLSKQKKQDTQQQKEINQLTRQQESIQRNIDRRQQQEFRYKPFLYDPEKAARSAEHALQQRPYQAYGQWLDEEALPQIRELAQAGDTEAQLVLYLINESGNLGHYLKKELTASKVIKSADRVVNKWHRQPEIVEGKKLEANGYDPEKLKASLEFWDSKLKKCIDTLTPTEQEIAEARLKAAREAQAAFGKLNQTTLEEQAQLQDLQTRINELSQQLEEVEVEITEEEVEKLQWEKFKKQLPNEVKQWEQKPYTLTPLIAVFPAERQEFMGQTRGFGGSVETGGVTGDLTLHFLDIQDHYFSSPPKWAQSWIDVYSEKQEQVIYEFAEETPDGQEKYQVIPRIVQGEKTGVEIVCLNDGQEGTRTFIPYGERIDFLETVRKPVIYLYPKKKTNISVTLDFKGKLTHFYPKFDHNTTWNVTAFPDGKIVNPKNNKSYRYLYWEGDYSSKWQLDKGFCIKGEELEDFLEQALSKIGLNSQEIADFITFWVPRLSKQLWIQVSFQTEVYEKIAQLEINPKPDSIIRVFAVFKKLNKEIAIAKQNIDKIKRSGFTMVEWGGVEI